MSSKEIIQAFQKNYNELNMISVSKSGKDYYFSVNNCLLYDNFEKRYITKIDNTAKRNKISADLDKVNNNYYIYLTVDIGDTLKISKPSILGSEFILPFVSGTEGPDGFKQNKARALLGIIGYLGQKSIVSISTADISSTNYATRRNVTNRPIATYFGLINGAPIIYFKLLQ